MSALKYLIPPSPNFRNWCPVIRITFSTTCGRHTTQNSPGIFSRLKGIFSSASANPIDDQRRTLTGFETTPKVPGSVADKPPKDSKIEERIFDRIKYINIPPKREDAGFRKEWGVSISDSSIEKEVSDEHTPNFVLKQKWGVNVPEPIKPNKKVAKKVLLQLPQREMKSADLTTMLERQFMDSMEKHGRVEMRNQSPPPIVDPGISVVPPIDEELDPLKPLTEDSQSTIALGEVREEEAFTSRAESGILRIEEGATADDDEDEVAAWEQVLARTKLRVEEMALAEQMKRIEVDKLHEEKFSILPEPPTPKLDVAVIKPLDSKLQEYVSPNEMMFDVKNMLHRVDSKKFHTLGLFFLCLSMGGPGKYEDEGETQFLPVSRSDDAVGSEEGFEGPQDIEDVEEPEVLNAAGAEDMHEGIEDIQKIVEVNTLKMSQEEKAKPETKDLDDYVRIPGDPYPFKKEYFEKWQMPHGNTRDNSSHSDQTHE